MESSNDYGPWMMVAFNVLLFGVIMAFGLILLSKGGKLIQESNGKLVTDASYSSIRAPQYSGLFLISIGMLIQWSFLMYAYYRLALCEERDIMKELPLQYQEYDQKIPAFPPISKTKNIYFNE